MSLGAVMTCGMKGVGFILETVQYCKRAVFLLGKLIQPIDQRRLLLSCFLVGDQIS